MSRVIWAKVILRDACDPGLPGDCAPVIQIEEASELEGLVSEHGVIFEEPIQEQETFEDQVDEDSLEYLPEDVEVPEPEGDSCSVDGLPWEASVCGEIERRILDRLLVLLGG